MSARYVGNKRLRTACHGWAISSLRASPGAKAYFDAHDPGPHTGRVALRKLANKLVGILHAYKGDEKPAERQPGQRQQRTQKDDDRSQFHGALWQGVEHKMQGIQGLVVLSNTIQFLNKRQQAEDG